MNSELVLVAAVGHIAVLALWLDVLLIPPSRILGPGLEVSRVDFLPRLGNSAGITHHPPGPVRIFRANIDREDGVQRAYEL